MILTKNAIIAVTSFTFLSWVPSCQRFGAHSKPPVSELLDSPSSSSSSSWSGKANGRENTAGTGPSTPRCNHNVWNTYGWPSMLHSAVHQREQSAPVRKIPSLSRLSASRLSLAHLPRSRQINTSRNVAVVHCCSHSVFRSSSSSSSCVY